MPTRKWRIGWGYGYVGTNHEEEVDAKKFLSMSDDEFAAATDEEIASQLGDYAHESAVERVEAWAVPVEEE